MWGKKALIFKKSELKSVQKNPKASFETFGLNLLFNFTL